MADSEFGYRAFAKWEGREGRVLEGESLWCPAEGLLYHRAAGTLALYEGASESRAREIEESLAGTGMESWTDAAPLALSVHSEGSLEIKGDFAETYLRLERFEGGWFRCGATTACNRTLAEAADDLDVIERIRKVNHALTDYDLRETVDGTGPFAQGRREAAERTLSGLLKTGTALYDPYWEIVVKVVSDHGFRKPYIAKLPLGETMRSLDEGDALEAIIERRLSFESASCFSLTGLSDYGVDQFCRTFARYAAEAACWLPTNFASDWEWVSECREARERRAEARLESMLDETVGEWLDRTRPDILGSDEYCGFEGDITFRELQDAAEGGTLADALEKAQLDHETSEMACRHLAELLEVPEWSVNRAEDLKRELGKASSQQGVSPQETEGDAEELRELEGALSPESAELHEEIYRLREQVASLIEDADVLRAYDAYITSACEMRLFDSGWMPVGVAEFRETEYMNCWVGRREGEDPFDWMEDMNRYGESETEGIGIK